MSFYLKQGNISPGVASQIEEIRLRHMNKQLDALVGYEESLERDFLQYRPERDSETYKLYNITFLKRMNSESCDRGCSASEPP